MRQACLLNSAACFLACRELDDTLQCCYQASRVTNNVRPCSFPFALYVSWSRPPFVHATGMFLSEGRARVQPKVVLTA